MNGSGGGGAEIEDVAAQASKPAPANLAAGVIHVLAVHDKAAALGIIPQFAQLQQLRAFTPSDPYSNPFG
jgi:hypothetical protein